MPARLSAGAPYALLGDGAEIVAPGSALSANAHTRRLGDLVRPLLDAVAAVLVSLERGRRGRVCRVRHLSCGRMGLGRGAALRRVGEGHGVGKRGA
jgi:hypothetical protein